ncbi:hypothetical protein TFLX_00796 [Thermoflexales bacterium]|nr:hypothetical protein TFLX_00796 [Thermoflexales bacterium]
MRAIDLAPHLKIDPVTALNSEPTTARVLVHPKAHSIIWDNGTAISADFLYSHSQLIGWVDKKWGNMAWQPIQFETALVSIEDSNNKVRASLLLDGVPFPALRFSSALFGIHENTPWYQVSFPGDDGKYEPELEEPQIVFDVLHRLVQMVNNAIKAKTDATISIMEHLQETGYNMYVASMSPRNAAICARRFKKNAT